ncbi:MULTISPECIES: hypothetical protein [Galbibacter]|uniref:Uncharacterized protein n=1 Tax=Galbibacter orientalis DSM 19592 TaxID=926559 RepID=I3C6K2_9FLAO|nr:hypothetical protein [Galbibacter orientalis]EIJ39245.1 hypothetical protein JoomaDRAFT_2257 [Galbibacter orientalis DSM 19592]
MNKIRIIGLAILVIGILVQYIADQEGTDFISGILIGVGAGLLIAGNLKRKSRE